MIIVEKNKVLKSKPKSVNAQDRVERVVLVVLTMHNTRILTILCIPQWETNTAFAYVNYY